MVITLFSENMFDPKVEEIAHAIQRYWSLRGLAVYPVNYFQTAKECVVAGCFGLRRFGIDLDADHHIVKQFSEWARDKYATDLWRTVFDKNTGDILRDWQEKRLPHILLVYGLTGEKEHRDLAEERSAYRVSMFTPGASPIEDSWFNRSIPNMTEDSRDIVDLLSKDIFEIRMK